MRLPWPYNSASLSSRAARPAGPALFAHPPLSQNPLNAMSLNIRSEAGIDMGCIAIAP